MSELGKIREGSPRVYRDRVFGRRGECLALPGSHSSDGLARFVFHPEDITDGERALAEWGIDDLTKAAALPEDERSTIFGLPIRNPRPAV